ncbi:MAG: hypothetical protein ACTSWN_06825 [Promethearchaeota archaeon]
MTDCPPDCPSFPNNCHECIKRRLDTAGIPNRGFEATIIMDEKEKIESSRDVIYRKYLDLLNIKAILVLDKNGICIYNHPIMGKEMDGNLIGGFIQANLSFSKVGMKTTSDSESTPSEGHVLSLKDDNLSSKPVLDFGVLNGFQVDHDNAKNKINVTEKILELNYLKFVLLVHEGEYIRSVLILDKSPSFELRNLLVQFTMLFERIYGGYLEDFFGDVSVFNEAYLVVEKVFESDLLYPYSVRLISPVEEKNLDELERIIYRHGLEISRKGGFFFISSIIEELGASLNRSTKSLIHSIYSLVKLNYFVPQRVEAAAKVKESREKMQAELEKKRDAYAAVYNIADKKEFKELGEMLPYISEKDAKNLIKKYMNKANSSLELGIYDDVRKCLELAKVVANEFGLLKEARKIERKIFELMNQLQNLEYDNAMRIAVSAEKKSDYLKSLQYYNQCLKLLQNEFRHAIDMKRIRSIERKIQALQSKLR